MHTLWYRFQNVINLLGIMFPIVLLIWGTADSYLQDDLLLAGVSAFVLGGYIAFIVFKYMAFRKQRRMAWKQP